QEKRCQSEAHIIETDEHHLLRVLHLPDQIYCRPEGDLVPLAGRRRFELGHVNPEVDVVGHAVPTPQELTGCRLLLRPAHLAATSARHEHVRDPTGHWQTTVKEFEPLDPMFARDRTTHLPSFRPGTR